MVSLSEGQKIEINAIVTRVNYSRNGSFYKVTDGTATFSFSSLNPYHPGDVISVTGVVEDIAELRIREESSAKYSGENEKQIRNEITGRLILSIGIKERELLVNDSIMDSLKPKIIETAKTLLAAQKLGRHTLLRFHSDADGISGAFAITKFLRCTAIQSNSAVYGEKDAIRDLSSIHHEYSPLVVLLDFGANKESEGGLKLLKASGAEIVLIDHHPPMENISQYASVFLSPWSVSKEETVSKYPAGYLAVEVARVAGEENLDELAVVSCAGDKSEILKVDQNARDKALVLDYLAIYSAYGNNLAFYKSVFEKEELFQSMLMQSKDKIAQIINAVKSSMKEQQFNGVAVYVVELEKAIKESEFPSRGKITTYLFEMFGNDKPVVVLGYGNKSIIIRINQLALEKDISADKLIVKVKESMKDFVESGGGHAKAAAIRAREGFTESVLDELVKEIKRVASGQ